MSPIHNRMGASPFLTITAAASLISARSAIVATLGLGLVLAVQYAWQVLNGLLLPEGGLLLVPSMAVLALLTGGFAANLALRSQPLPPRWFVPAALLIAIAIRVAYYLTVEPEWISDFGRYWRAANELAVADQFNINSVYEQRAVPYLVPIAEWFGSSRDVVKFSNIGLLCLIQVLGYDILRRSLGHAAAQCFTVLWIAAPEPLYSAMIPSHDLAAMAQLALVTWLLTLAITDSRRGLRWLAYATPIAFMLVALELQRGISLIVMASVLATGLAGVLINRRYPALLRGDQRETQRLFMLGLLIIPLYAVFMVGAARLNLTMPSSAAEEGMLRYTTAHATSLSDGSYGWMKAFDDAFTNTQTRDLAQFSDLRKSLVLSDFVERPFGRLVNASDRLVRLYSLGGSIYFYSADESPRTTLAMRAYNNTYAIVFALLALVGLYRLLTRRDHPIIVGFLLVMIASITLSLVLVAENQPRYLFMVWFVGAFSAAAGLVRSSESPENVRGGSRQSLQWFANITLTIGMLVVQTGIVAVLVVTAGWLMLSQYDTASGRIISDWTLSAEQPSAPAIGEDWIAEFANPLSDVVVGKSRRSVAQKQFGKLSLTLQLPHQPSTGDRVVATRRVCTSDGTRNDLAFFLYTPYKYLKRRGSFELQVSIDGDSIWAIDLPHAVKPVPIEVPNILPANSCAEISFILHSKVTVMRDSWRRASRVEIYFPRLIDHTK